jgi:hypothetical protein
MRHEAQVRAQEERADNRRIRRPDKDFVRSYPSARRQRFRGGQPQVQPSQPTNQPAQTIK